MTDVQLTRLQRDMLDWFIEAKHSYNMTACSYHSCHTKPRATADSLVALGLLEVIEDDGTTRTYRLPTPKTVPQQWGYFLHGAGEPEPKPFVTFTNEPDARRYIAEQTALLRDGFGCEVFPDETADDERYTASGGYLRTTVFFWVAPLTTSEVES